MYKTILLPVSNKAKERSFKGFEHAIALCGETLLLLHVCPPIPNIIGGEKRKELIKKDEETAAEMLAPYIEEAENKGIKHRIIVDHGSPAESIVKTAKEQNADLIVMFTDGRDTVTDMMLGSCTERVLRETDIALLAVRK